jgi:hypothetical protein
MKSRLLRALLVLGAGPCLAPLAGAQRPASLPFDSFLRVAGLTNKPVADLARIWPGLSLRAPESATLALSAAHRITVSVQATRVQLDSNAATLDRTSYAERLPDTLSLRRRTIELVNRLTAAHGPPDVCDTPLGPPAFLFAPQTVTRFWTHGVAGFPTRLQWNVSAGPSYVITVDVGTQLGREPDAIACDAQLP